MRTIVKIAAVVAVIGAIAVVALAGSALAYGGNTGYSQGMMGNHGTGMMNGHSNWGANGQHMSGFGQTTGQTNGQWHQGNCPMYVNGTVSQGVSGTPTTQTHCFGCR